MPGKNKMPVQRDARTCQACGGTSAHMYACSRCYLINYCSQRCCDRDWSNHKEDCKFVTWHRKHVGSNFCHHCFAHACPHATSKLKRCGGCLRVSYCSKECQKLDWVSHVAICTGKKNRKSKETLLQECLEEQAAEEEARASEIAKKKGKKKADLEDLVPDLYDFEDSPFTKEQRLKLELQTRRQKELYKKLQDKKLLETPEPEPESKIEVWEEKFFHSKEIPNITLPGEPISHTVKVVEHSIRYKDKLPKAKPFKENPDDTNTYEVRFHEKQKDGSVLIKRQFIANDQIKNEAQLEEFARQLGQEFFFNNGFSGLKDESD